MVGGLEKGQPFLGYINLLGTHYTDKHITTGMLLIIYLFKEVNRLW